MEDSKFYVHKAKSPASIPTPIIIIGIENRGPLWISEYFILSLKKPEEFIKTKRLKWEPQRNNLQVIEETIEEMNHDKMYELTKDYVETELIEFYGEHCSEESINNSLGASSLIAKESLPPQVLSLYWIRNLFTNQIQIIKDHTEISKLEEYLKKVINLNKLVETSIE